MRLTPASFRAALLGALAISCGQTDPSHLGNGCTDPVLMENGVYLCAKGYLHRSVEAKCASEVPRDGTIDFPAGIVVSSAGSAGLSSVAGAGGAAGSAGSVGAGGVAGSINAGGAAGIAGGTGGPYVGDYTISRDECSRDAECTGVREYCTVVQTNPATGCMVEPTTPDYARFCIQGCVEDADCGPTQICTCGSPMGHCEDVSSIAGCKSDADCKDGALCLQNATTDYGLPRRYACELPGDQCQANQDCTNQTPGFCQITPNGRICGQAYICGRPFLVAGQPRLAGARRNVGWAEGRSGALERPDDPGLVRELVDHWTEIALMEHASVAAFARFTLQLMALGAPAELIDAATQAQADEIRHARLAFELASHYGGRPVAPGRLDVGGPLLDTSLEDICATTIREGCVGETMAALEIARAAEQAEDAELRAMLEAIAADEARHAALAWKTVHWLLARHPELHAVCEREFARAVESVCAPNGTDDDSSARSARFGVVSPNARAAIGIRASSDVIAPCARALLHSDDGRFVALAV